MKSFLPAAAAALFLQFCGSAGAAGGAAASVLTLPDGTKIGVELALTPQTQTAGLMYRETLADDAGMLFVFQDDAPRTFWMKNTYVSLDIIFLDDDLKIRNIFHRVPRSSKEQPEEEVARVSAQARFVLELAAGRARRSGLKPGSRLKSSVELSKSVRPPGRTKGKRP